MNARLHTGFSYKPSVCSTSSSARLFGEPWLSFTCDSRLLEAHRSSELSVPSSRRAGRALSPRRLTASVPSWLHIVDLRTIVKASSPTLRSEPMCSKELRSPCCRSSSSCHFPIFDTWWSFVQPDIYHGLGPAIDWNCWFRFWKDPLEVGDCGNFNSR